jgi:hypothetical protein
MTQAHLNINIKSFSEFKSSINETADIMFFPGDNYVTSMGKEYEELGKLLGNKFSDFIWYSFRVKFTRAEVQAGLKNVEMTFGKISKITYQDIKDYLVKNYKDPIQLLFPRIGEKDIELTPEDKKRIVQKVGLIFEDIFLITYGYNIGRFLINYLLEDDYVYSLINIKGFTEVLFSVLAFGMVRLIRELEHFYSQQKG